MDAIKQLDALCLPVMVADSPVTFAFGGKDYTATTGARDTMKSLTEGGFINDQEFTLLVEVAQFGDDERPSEREKITVCVDVDGIPCASDDANLADTRITARITRIGRAGAGLTFTCTTEAR